MNNAIKILSSELINKIAAGEVVERPASIVKELIENSLDAGANQIKISIKEGGKEQITIWDNGEGIRKEDILLVLERHTTSKITDISDLTRIKTYGFRGEALSSIAAVSQLNLKTCYHKDSLAYQISVNTIQQKSQIEITSRSTGTTISITNLFFNVPARAKFLKSASTEYRYILNIITQFSLAHPQLQFELKHNDRQIFNLVSNKGKDPYLARWLEVLKVEKKDVISLFYDGENYKITGLILQPHMLSGKARFEHLFINNRPVTDKSLRQAVNQGYHEFIPDFKRPSYLIMLSINPEMVDVNVHPRKTEVRFVNPFRVFKAVQEAVQIALKKSFQSETGIYHTNVHKPSLASQFNKKKKSSSITWDKRMDSAVDRLRTPNNLGNNLMRDSGREQIFDMSNLTTVKQDLIEDHKISQKEYTKTSLEEILSVFQVMHKYLVVDLGKKIWLVDQHAAAERIRFEKLLKQYKEKSMTQLMVVPLELTLSMQELEIVQQHLSLIEKIGFKAVIKKNKLFISGMPVLFVKSKNMMELLKDLISEIGQEPDYLTENEFDRTDSNINKKLRNLLATLACHSSIRAQDNVSITEAKKMISDLISCKQPFTCPHGRPTIWTLSREEVDGHFDRTY